MSAPATFTRAPFALASPEPWRNGAGTTRELLREPGVEADGSFAWRISVADVIEDGPFSSFPGVDRVLMLCEGIGMTVVVNGAKHPLRRFDAVTFTGEDHVTASLHRGPTIDLNVMTRRETTTAAVEVARVDGHANVRGHLEGDTVLVPLEGRLRVSSVTPDHPAEPLEVFDAVRLAPRSSVQVEGRGRLARIDLTHRR